MKLKLGKKKLEICLGVLIPWNEYNDRGIFETRLKTLLAAFEFRGQAISCQVNNILVRPEGGGIAATYIRQNGNDWLHQHKIAVLMFGHRNVTSLYFDRGKLTGDSPLLGFTNFLDSVIERKSLDPELLSNAIIDTISQAYNDTHKSNESYNHYPDWIEYPPIIGLAQAKDDELKQAECELIDEAITVACQEYWEKIEKWLNRTIPNDIEIVILNGGAGRFLEPDLERYFNACHAGNKDSYYWKRTGNYIAIDKSKPMPEIIWGYKIINLVREKFNINIKKDTQNVANRLADCYGLFDYLIESNNKGA